MSTIGSEAVSTELRERFATDGAVLLPNVLSTEWVDLLAAGLDECYAEPDGMSSSLKGERSELRIDQFPAARSALLQRFIHESPVASLVGAMVEGPVRFYMDQMFVKPAGEQMMTAWHQDTGYYNVDGANLIRAWVSPDHVPRNASLEVVRGSHRWNVIYRTLAGRDPDAVKVTRRSSLREEAGTDFAYGNAIMDTSLPKVPDIAGHPGSFDILGWDYNPGDVILFCGNMLHGARGNVALDHARRAHAAMFAGPGVQYVERLGQVIPDPVGLAAHKPKTGQLLEEFGDVFPLVWSPQSKRGV